MICGYPAESELTNLRSAEKKFLNRFSRQVICCANSMGQFQMSSFGSK